MAYALYFNYGVTGGAPPPPPPPNNVDVDGDGVPDAQISFSMYQALYLKFNDGGSTWKYPASRTTLEPLYLKDFSNGGISAVSNLQTYIYFRLDSSLAVSKVTFTANAELELYDRTGGQVYSLGGMNVNQESNDVADGDDTYLISASMTSSQFEDLLDSKGVASAGTMTYKVILSNIKATVNFSSGQTKQFGLTGVQATQNQLLWSFTRSTAMPSQITSESVEWQWIN